MKRCWEAKNSTSGEEGRRRRSERKVEGIRKWVEENFSDFSFSLLTSSSRSHPNWRRGRYENEREEKIMWTNERAKKVIANYQINEQQSFKPDIKLSFLTTSQLRWWTEDSQAKKKIFKLSENQEKIRKSRGGIAVVVSEIFLLFFLSFFHMINDT